MDQQVADNAFLDTAHHLIQSKWDPADFPLGQTQAIIVAPEMDWTQFGSDQLGAPRGPYYPNQVGGLDRMLRASFTPQPYDHLPYDPSTILKLTYIPTGQGIRYTKDPSDVRDIVAVNIERRGSNHNLVLYVDGKDTGKYLTLW